VGDQSESLAPHISCVTCVRLLTGWVINGSHQMPFAILLIQLLLLTDRYHLQIQTHSEIS